MGLQLTSPAFEEGKPIPAKYTCEGDDVSPPLAWSVPPEGTKSFVLINDDPDAPGRVWVHWVLYNIPPDARELKENVPKRAKLSDGSFQGMTDFGRVGYGGPCPPSGVHRYFFKLYALNTTLSLPPEATKSQVEQQMKGHVLAEASLMGTYRKRDR